MGDERPGSAKDGGGVRLLGSLRGILDVGPGGEPRLKAVRCGGCGRHHFPPPVPLCPRCGGDDLEEVVLSRRGTIHSFTEVCAVPPGFAAPLLLAYVDLPEGVRLLGQLDGTADGLAPGVCVEMVTGSVRTDADGTEVIGYRFRRAE